MAIDAELVANLNKAKSGGMMYAFAQKGASGSLVVNRTITPNHIAQAKEKAGGGTLFRGQCFGEDEQIIFEVAKEPPATLAAAIKRAITLDAGLALKVVVRVAGDGEANGQAPQAEVDTVSANPDAPMAKASIPAPPPRPGSEAAFKNRLKALQAQFSAAGGPTPDQQMLLNQAFSAARDKDYAAALEALNQADGSKKAKKEEPDTLESTTFKRVLADLKPRFDKARAIDSALMPQMGDILSLAKAGRYADALEMLDKLEIDVDRTLAAAPKPAAKPAVSGDEFKARLKALLPKYNAAIKEDAALLAQLRPLMSQVIAKGNANQFEQALPLLIQIEKALAGAKAGGKADATTTAASGMQRLTGLMPAIKSALSAGGPNVARIQTLVAAVGGLLKNKDTVQADKVLAELEALLKPATGAGAADLGAEWKTKLAQWSPAIKTALAAKGPNAATIGKLLAQATALSKPGGDMAQALAKLTECHDLAAGGAAAGGDPAGEWKAKLAQWSPAIKKAIAAKGPKSAEMMKLLAQATALSKPGGDMVQAIAKLTECHALTAAAPPAEDSDLATFQAKAREVRAVIEQLSQDNPRREELLVEVDEVLAMADSMPDEVLRVLGITERDAKDALVDETEEAASGTGAAEDQAQGDAKEEEGEDEAAPTTHMARWNKAKDKVDAQINRLCDWLRKTREKAALVAAGKLAAAMDLFKVDLTSSLMNLDNASREEKKQLYPKVSQLFKNYKKSLLADRLLAAAENNPFVRVNARKPLLAALNQIQKKLDAEINA